MNVNSVKWKRKGDELYDSNQIFPTQIINVTATAFYEKV